MLLLDLTLATADENLALDERLFRSLEGAGARGEDLGGHEVLRLWESPHPVVVLGRSGSGDDVDWAACEAAGVPVRRRASGGGTVLLGPGCLCFSLVLAYARWPALRDVPASYRLVLGRIARCLDAGRLVLRGESDLALGARKVSGNAQLRGRHGLLHHGTLLYAFPPAQLPLLLREPRRQPAYRARRRHHDFVGNLPTSVTLIKARLAEAWHARPPREPDPAGSALANQKHY